MDATDPTELAFQRVRETMRDPTATKADRGNAKRMVNIILVQMERLDESLHAQVRSGSITFAEMRTKQIEGRRTLYAGLTR